MTDFFAIPDHPSDWRDSRCQADSLDVVQRLFPDNTACEGFFGRLKTELFYPRAWQATSIEQFFEAVDSYIRRYNAKRIKISRGSLSPLEYRESLGLPAKRDI